MSDGRIGSITRDETDAMPRPSFSAVQVTPPSRLRETPLPPVPAKTAAGRLEVAAKARTKLPARPSIVAHVVPPSTLRNAVGKEGARHSGAQDGEAIPAAKTREGA